MQHTNIEWTDMTVNPIRALAITGGDNVHRGHYCEKISQGCTNCYASSLQRRFQMPEFQEQRRMGDDIEVYLDESKLMEVLRRRKPTNIFWCDMTDMFGDWVPDEWLDKMFAVMALTPQHTHQVLTKRPERMRGYFSNSVLRVAMYRRSKDWGLTVDQEVFKALTLPLPNVWLGVSVEDQKAADERIPILLQTPAAVRWISAEPLLGQVDLTRIIAADGGWQINSLTAEERYDGNIRRGIYPHLDWVVVGGESGPKARPFDIQWARDLRDQCQDAGVAFYMKQLGSDPRNGEHITIHAYMQPRLKSRKGGDPIEWPEDLRVREFPEVVSASD